MLSQARGPVEDAAAVGLLLTGGASRRFGRDKATLCLGPQSETLASHLGSMLERVCGVAFEVGPGFSGLSVPNEPDPRSGPLSALAVGGRFARSVGLDGPVMVLATDLPLLSEELLARIARWPAPAGTSVVPLSGNKRQPLCARWSAPAIDRVLALHSAGVRRLQAALSDEEVCELGPLELAGFDLERELADVDEPDALRRLGLDGG